MELAITGVPGWLTHAFLDTLRREPIDGYDTVRALVHRPLNGASLHDAYPNVSRWIPFELERPTSFASAFDGCAGVVHAAGAIHVRKPKDWFEVNTHGTIALAKAAKASGVRRFVFLSSNAVGGANASADEILTEDVPPKPLSLYGLSKWRAEQGLLALHEPDTFEIAILRPSMFYGPPVPERHIDIYKRILSGTMPLVGDGHFRRSVTYIDDLVQATRLALTRPEAAAQTFYIVDEEVYTTRSIVEAMARALGVKPRFLHLPRLVGPICYQLDRLISAAGFYSAPLHLVGESDWHVAISSAKAIRELGYRPAGSFQEGMNRAIAWCRERGKL